VLFHYAEHDDHIPMSAVDKVRAAMAGKRAEVHVYPGAMHGFNCWARASYRAPSAALAHGRSLQFLAANLFDA
jgi:carboxymethylenebutenolidase